MSSNHFTEYDPAVLSITEEKRILTVNNSVDKTQQDYNEIAKYRNT
jgi:hypothetical protein